MLEDFVTWELLANYGTLISIVFTIVEFTKELPFIDMIKTKYYSAVIAFILILSTQLYLGTFEYWDILLYSLSSIFISLSANGLSDFNKK